MDALYDCTRCGACCHGQRNYVQVFAEDAVRLGAARVAEFVAPAVVERLPTDRDDPPRFMKMSEGRCSALIAPEHLLCAVYEERPLLCRVFEAGSAACREARARMELFQR